MIMAITPQVAPNSTAPLSPMRWTIGPTSSIWTTMPRPPLIISIEPMISVDQ